MGGLGWEAGGAENTVACQCYESLKHANGIDGEMRAPLATRSNMEGGGSSASKDLLAKVKAASSDKGVSEMKEVRLCSFCTTLCGRRRRNLI